MILASISGGQSLGKPLPDLSRHGQSLCEGPFSVSCRKSKPFKPSGAVGFDEKSRLGQPEDIANVVALLVSDDANWITGQNIRANGGTI